MGHGRFERVIETSQKRIKAEPDESFGYSNLASANFYLDRFPEAERALQLASSRKVEESFNLNLLYTIAVLKGDQGQMDRIAALAKGKRGAEHPDGARAGSRAGAFRPPASRRSVIEPGP